MSDDHNWLRQKAWETADRATALGVVQSAGLSIALGTTQLNGLAKTHAGRIALPIGLLCSTALLVWLVNKTDAIFWSVEEGSDDPYSRVWRHTQKARYAVLVFSGLITLVVAAVVAYS